LNEKFKRVSKENATLSVNHQRGVITTFSNQATFAAELLSSTLDDFGIVIYSNIMEK